MEGGGIKKLGRNNDANVKNNCAAVDCRSAEADEK